MEIVERMTAAIMDRGFVPGDVLDNFAALRDAGFTADEISQHFDAAAVQAFKRTEQEVAQGWLEIESHDKAVLTAAINQALNILRFPYQEDRAVAVLENAISETAQ